MEFKTTPQREEELLFLEYFNTDRLFRSIKRADYALLYAIRAHAGERGRPGRTYLADLSREMGIPIPSLSRTVERLQDRGFVTWKTDRTAGQTYVKLTSKAVELMDDEHRRMREVYDRIRAEIPPDELARSLATLKRIAEIVRSAE